MVHTFLLQYIFYNTIEYVLRAVFYKIPLYVLALAYTLANNMVFIYDLYSFVDNNNKLKT